MAWRILACSFFALAASVSVEAVRTLPGAAEAEPSTLLNPTAYRRRREVTVVPPFVGARRTGNGYHLADTDEEGDRR